MLNILFSAYIILAVIKLWMFMWQRTALNICRANDMPRNLTGVIVPYWQVILVWPIWVLKFAVLILILIFFKWYIPIIMVVADIGISAIFPIPHSFFLNKMEKRLKNPNVRLARKEYSEEKKRMKESFLDAIRIVREKYNV